MNIFTAVPKIFNTFKGNLSQAGQIIVDDAKQVGGTAVDVALGDKSSTDLALSVQEGYVQAAKSVGTAIGGEESGQNFEQGARTILGGLNNVGSTAVDVALGDKNSTDLANSVQEAYVQGAKGFGTAIGGEEGGENYEQGMRTAIGGLNNVGSTAVDVALGDKNSTDLANSVQEAYVQGAKGFGTAIGGEEGGENYEQGMRTAIGGLNNVGSTAVDVALGDKNSTDLANSVQEAYVQGAKGFGTAIGGEEGGENYEQGMRTAIGGLNNVGSIAVDVALGDKNSTDLANSVQEAYVQGAKGFGTAIGGEEGGENYEQGMRTAIGGLNNVGSTAVDVALGDKDSTDLANSVQEAYVQGAKGFGTAIGGEEGGENYEQGMRTAIGGLNNVGSNAVDVALGDKNSTDLANSVQEAYVQGAKGFGTAIGGEEGGENYEQGMRTAIGGLNNVGSTAVDVALGDKNSTDLANSVQEAYVQGAKGFGTAIGGEEGGENYEQGMRTAIGGLNNVGSNAVDVAPGDKIHGFGELGPGSLCARGKRVRHRDRRRRRR